MKHCSQRHLQSFMRLSFDWNGWFPSVGQLVSWTTHIPKKNISITPVSELVRESKWIYYVSRPSSWFDLYFASRTTATKLLVVAQAASGARHLAFLVRKTPCRAEGGSANSVQVSQSLPDHTGTGQLQARTTKAAQMYLKRVQGHTQFL